MLMQKLEALNAEITALLAQGSSLLTTTRQRHTAERIRLSCETWDHDCSIYYTERKELDKRCQILSDATVISFP
jgi:hypothetical protein